MTTSFLMPPMNEPTGAPAWMRWLSMAWWLFQKTATVVIVASGGSEASVRSKGIGVLADGSTGSVVYEDLVVCVPDGWRIAHRRVLPRRTPLQA